MTENTKTCDKNIILFVGTIPQYVIDNIREFEQAHNRRFRIALLYNKKDRALKDKKLVETYDIVIPCEFDSADKITEALCPYKKELLAITSRQEKTIPHLKQVIPHVPYLRTPTAKSLDLSTQKVLMRRRFRVYDKKITPDFVLAQDAKKATRKKLEEKLGFPVIVKPAGLAQSILVGICFHHEELESFLKKTFIRMRRIYKETNGRGEPELLVEQFLDGQLYSIDAYITSRGKVTFCPPVAVKTGQTIGFDDFFGYQQITPTLLNKESIEEAECIAKKGIHALGLRSTTTHVELLKTEKGWKVVEIGPRVGGFRDQMYKKSFGINHTMNDIFIRIPEKVVVPKKVLGYSAALKFFAKKEGKLIKLTGIKKAQELKSFYNIKINKKLGNRCLYAKNGGQSVFNIMLFNKDRSKLLADIRRLEKFVSIETK
ncbi:MAG: ATP-grasp domain-containing protein [Candidatus Pacebacteria bacterium]|nr:ATP-grasp domain-containing protein [Candidatus Paceibacterota bacterium]